MAIAHEVVPDSPVGKAASTPTKGSPLVARHATVEPQLQSRVADVPLFSSASFSASGRAATTGARPLSARGDRTSNNNNNNPFSGNNNFNHSSANNNGGVIGEAQSAAFTLRVHAIRYYKRAIQADRRNAASYGAYAHFLSELGQDAEAEAHYIEALLREPNNGCTLAGYAALLQRMGNMQQAEVFAERSRAVDRMLSQFLDISASISSQELLIRRTMTPRSLTAGLQTFPGVSTEQLLDL